MATLFSNRARAGGNSGIAGSRKILTQDAKRPLRRRTAQKGEHLLRNGGGEHNGRKGDCHELKGGDGEGRGRKRKKINGNDAMGLGGREKRKTTKRRPFRVVVLSTRKRSTRERTLVQ